MSETPSAEASRKAQELCPDGEEHQYHHLGQPCPSCHPIAVALSAQEVEIARLKTRVGGLVKALETVMRNGCSQRAFETAKQALADLGQP